MSSTVCPKEIERGDYLALLILPLTGGLYHSETDRMVMPIFNNEENKSVQISNSSKLLVKRSQHNFGLCAKKNEHCALTDSH